MCSVVGKAGSVTEPLAAVLCVVGSICVLNKLIFLWCVGNQIIPGQDPGQRPKKLILLFSKKPNRVYYVFFCLN